MPTPDVWHARAREILDREQNRGGARVDVAKVPSGTHAGFDSPPPPSIHAFGSGEDYEGRVSASERYINRDLKRLGIEPLQLTLWHEHTVECYDC